MPTGEPARPIVLESPDCCAECTEYRIQAAKAFLPHFHLTSQNKRGKNREPKLGCTQVKK